jgi:NAD(P)H-dependent FMN reductase
LLRAGARVAPPGVIVNLCRSVNHLPHFNPDLNRDPGPGAVVTFRAHVRAADALLICSPEYAHGVPGTLKNALDWLVGSGEVVNKPVALIQTSARARYVYDSLIGIGAAVTRRPLPHHRAYGSVHGDSSGYANTSRTTKEGRATGSTRWKAPH